MQNSATAEDLDSVRRQSTDADRSRAAGSAKHRDDGVALAAGELLNAMTIDVEDYFQVSAFERYVARDDWETLERRVEYNTDTILALMDGAGVKGTFFTLGWIAERHPQMIRRIADAGHEIASHGWDHVRVTTMTPTDFAADVRRAKATLEDICGQTVAGYRAPSYSFDERTGWAHDVLADTGHAYSSSVAPVKHDIYGMPDASRFAYPAAGGRLVEIPISTSVVMGKNLMCAGGGWFRLYPYALTRYLLRRLNRAECQSGVFYFHPWEIDAGQPRVTGIDARTRFRHYLNLSRMPGRVDALLRDFAWHRMDRVFADEIERLAGGLRGRPVCPGSVPSGVAPTCVDEGRAA